MKIILVFIQISFISPTFIYDTYKINTVLNKYSSKRCKRCTVFDKSFDSFVERTVGFIDKTQRYGESRRYMNVSDCTKSDSVVDSSSNIKRHIWDGLFLDPNVSETHWHEYKVSTRQIDRIFTQAILNNGVINLQNLYGEIHGQLIVTGGVATALNLRSAYNKQYPTEHHEMAALSNWLENLRRVAEHNQRYLAGEISYSLNLNHFGDLGLTEYFKKILKLFDTFPLFDPAEDHHKTAYRNVRHRKTPKKVDWRSKGFKPKLEKQYKCGACYAFAVAHALQAQLYKKHGDWSELSPQQIVDCSFQDGNMGCDGGSLRAALRYAAREGLIMEDHYPYTGKRGRCRLARHVTRFRPRRWALLPPGDEEGMERALATIGPLAVGLNASPFTFQLYRSGIYDDPFCFPWKLNHAMLLVGYTPDYWLLLNWWGKDWGEGGYMRIRRGFNRCGVANMAAYVEL